MTEQEIFDELCKEFDKTHIESRLRKVSKALHQKFSEEMQSQNEDMSDLNEAHKQSLIDVERDMLNACEEYGVLVARSMFNEKLKKEGRDER